MASLFKILAASVGGGLMIGAGIRLGEALVSKSGDSKSGDSEPDLSSGDDLSEERIARIEDRLSRTLSTPVPPQADRSHEWQSLFSGIGERIDRQQSDVDAIRRQMSTAAHALESVSSLAGNFQDDIQKRVAAEMDRRIAAVEENLRARLETSQRESAAAVLSVLENRISPRIGRLEADIVHQTSAVSELRECSLKTEQSIQRLVSVLDRMVSRDARDAAKDPGPGPTRLSAVPGR